MVNNINWLRDIDQRIFNTIQLMQEGNYSYFRYSRNGDLYNQSHKWGLGQLVFAVKILYMIDRISHLSNEQVNNLTKSIIAFEGRDSYIYDPLISKLTLKTRLKGFIRSRDFDLISNEQVKRAETRQAAAALLCLGAKPSKLFLHIPYSVKGVDDYLGKLNWSKPWGAGSHLSHLLFFYRTNRDLFDHEVALSNKLIDHTIGWVNKLQSSLDGSWYKGEVPAPEKINGAMKILTGFSAVNYYQIDYADKLIDTCLASINDSHACDNFNIVYVLYFCSRLTDHRQDEVKEFFLERLSLYKQYYHDEGGFSFYKDQANSVYYGANITKGLIEYDIHGTVLFTWGIALISQVVDLGFKFNVPIT